MGEEEEDLEEVCQGERVVESTHRLLRDNKRNVSSRSWLRGQGDEAELAANLLSQCERDEGIASLRRFVIARGLIEVREMGICNHRCTF